MRKFWIVAMWFAFFGCDVIPPENARQTQPTTPKDSLPQAKRIVLIEEFTGHQCGNCPQASKVIKNLVALYGERVAVVAIHAGFFARTNSSGKYSRDFTTPEGNLIDAYFGASQAGLPKGMVNRMSFDGSVLLGHTAWPGKVAELLKEEPQAFITLNLSYRSDTRQLTATAKTDFLANLTGEYKIAMALTEDSIISWQKDYSLENQDVPDYRHDYVLRDMLNGEWGETLITNPTKGSSATQSLPPYTIPAKWDDNNLHLVVYVYAADSRIVIQAARAKVPKN